MFLKDFEEGKQYRYKPTGEVLDFGYIGQTKKVIMYEPGCCNMQDSVAVDPWDLEPVKEQLTDLETFCEKIIDLSITWTGTDEEQIPALKTIRTLAGYYLNKE